MTPERPGVGNLILAPIAALALTAGCMSLQPQSPTLVNAAHSGQAVHLYKGDTLVVALESGSGGYRWVTQPLQGEVLRQIGMSDLLPAELAPGMVGEPNDMVYRFRANDVGSTTLVLALERMADAASPQRSVRYDVTVDPRPGAFEQAWRKSR